LSSITDQPDIQPVTNPRAHNVPDHHSYVSDARTVGESFGRPFGQLHEKMRLYGLRECETPRI
jgi:hypothetical protein